MDSQLAVAREAAEILSRDFGPQLQIELEKQLAAPDQIGVHTYVGVAEVVAVAGFILAAAQFIYEIYKDQRDRGITAESIKREVRVKVDAPSQLSIQVRDQIIDVVVSQALKAN